MMTSISILMTLRSCYTFSASSETDFLLTNPQPGFEREIRKCLSVVALVLHTDTTRISSLSANLLATSTTNLLLPPLEPLLQSTTTYHELTLPLYQQYTSKHTPSEILFFPSSTTKM
uniref:(northern house mosquito) hypothetical protein n=1 Tax=Culex pipiens TaxID=7175 RepID=A0A8D8DHJ3_CULPI